MKSLSDFVAAIGSGTAQFLEREAGHSIISIACIWIAMVFMSPELRAQAARDVLMVGIGYLGRGMGSAKRSGGTN